MPLSLTGVAQPLAPTAAQPDPLQSQALANLFAQSAPPQAAPMQAAPVNYPAMLDEATQRDVQLQQAAAQYAPQQYEQSSILNALAAVGNIAGAAAGKGSVGDPALRMAEQLRQEGRMQQETFFRRVRDEEERLKEEKAALLKAQNNALRADSLRPLVSRIKDPKEQAALYAQIATGGLDEAQAYMQKYEEMQLDKAKSSLELQLKRQQFSTQATKDAQEIIKNGLSIEKAERDKAAETGTLNNLPAAAKRELMAKQGKQYNDVIKDDVELINRYLAADRLVGGFGTPAAEAKIARILGLGGSIRGQFTGSTEDREVFQAINNLFSVAKTKDFGASFTADEKKLMQAGVGFSLGGALTGNTFADPKALNNTMSKMADFMGGKLASAANGIDPAVQAELSKDGFAFKSLDNFTRTRMLHQEIGGYAGNLDNPPKSLKQSLGLSNDEWLKLSPLQKLELIKATK